MPAWTGWCMAPDAVEGVGVEGGNGGWYYNVASNPQTFPHIAVVGNHISLVGAQVGLAHVTWELKSFDDEGQWYDDGTAYDVKLYHYFSIDVENGTYSVSTRDNEYGSNYANLINRYGGLPDDVVDADTELAPYSNELMSGFMEAFVEVNPPGGGGTDDSEYESAGEESEDEPR